MRRAPSIWLAMLACALRASLSGAVAGGPQDAAGAERQPRIEVGLSQYGLSWEKNNPELLFSNDGKEMCLWWRFGYADSDHEAYPAKFLIFDLAGRRLGAWGDTNFLEALRPFPGLAWRWARRGFLAPPPNRQAGAVAFSDDLSIGVRITVSKLDDLDMDKPPEDLYVAEMWHLSEPVQKLWSVELPAGRVVMVDVHKFIGTQYNSGNKPLLPHNWASGPLLVNLDDQNCAELDPGTGKIVRTFTYGPIEKEGEARVPAQRLGASKGGSPGQFSAYACVYEPTHRWIACGSSEDRRMRVIDISASEKVLFEAHGRASPQWLLGGDWSAWPISFFGGGRLLASEYEFERRFGPYKHETEVYDTSSWKTVWKTDDSKIQSFTLSPDGRTMAYVRGTVLIIAPFEPMIGQNRK